MAIKLFTLIFISLGFANLSSAETIKIGVVGPRTGSAAAEGTAFDEGIALALDAIRAKGGIHGSSVEVVFEDTGGGPEKAAAAFEKLVTKDKVAIVLGESHSSAALAEIEVANRYHTPFIVAEAWADAIMEKKYPSVFRAGPYNTDVVNSTIVQFIKEGHFKKVSIVAENSDWGKGIGALTDSALKKEKIEHSLTEVDQNAKDFYPSLNKVKTEKPDLVLAYIYSFGLHTFVSQARELSVSPNALVLDGAGPPSLWGEFWTNVGKAGDGELFISPMHESVQPNAEAKAFWNAYKKKFSKSPSDYKIRSAYITVLLAADALERANSTEPSDVVNALEKTNFSAPTGKIHFGTKQGDIHYHQWSPQMLAVQWQNRKQVVVFPKNVATGTIEFSK